MRAYGVVGDPVDEHICMGESTCLEATCMFLKAVVATFNKHWLTWLKGEDTTRLMAIGNSRGFLGMFGSINCMP
jgi:hypothetical protein